MTKAKRFLSMLLAVCLVLGLIPTMAFAANGTHPFTDVSNTAWYSDAVQYVYEHDMMVGTSSTKFSPDSPTSRGMIVTILHRLEGLPSATGTAFTDVPSGQWYTNAVAWASANNIVNGYGNSKFGPNDPITREQMAAILYRYAEYKEYDTTITGSAAVFSDGKFVSSYAVDAANWAIGVGLLQGVGNNTLSPAGRATRAQVATILMRFCEDVVPDVYYTVTFNANADDVENLPVPQTVKAGECSVEPAVPFRAGYTFEGWFTDALGTTKYDFATPVTSDIDLFAQWGDADNAEDPYDTEVDPNSTYELSANILEVNVNNTPISVVFKVGSTLTVESFELYCDGIDTGIALYDNGGYYDTGEGDDIPGDGVYTGVYTINEDTEVTRIFTAKAQVGETTITTNEIEIFVYEELTDSQISTMEEIESRIAELMESAVGPEHTTAQQRTEARYDAVMEYLATLVASGVIRDLDGDKSSGAISFIYAETGVEGGALCSEISNGEASIDRAGVSSYIDDGYNQVSMLSLDISDLEYITYKERAIILNYCAQNDPEQISRVNSYTKVGGILENSGFEVDNEFEVTVDDFKSLQNYQFIATDCHGSFYKGTPVICTEQAVTSANKKTYSADLKSHIGKSSRISAVTVVGGGTYYWIQPEFFNYYYQNDPLDCSIFYLNVCEGAYQNTKLVDAILGAGADAVVAYSDTVYTFYGTVMLEDIVESLLNGDSIEQAVSDAKAENGVDDLVWGANQGWSSTELKPERAVCGVYGDADTILHNSLSNGNFDSFLNWIGEGLISWKTYGDARSIYKLSGLKPQSLPKMAIISSGFGSMNDETTSCIYQTILVPENVTTIEFSYDVVSEEPMEYVGTEYDDIFQVDILNTDGEILETLVYESVNTSTWYAIDGIDFPGGDDTTYHTRWQQVSSDVIAKYCGQLVVLRFTVQDAGDSIYDTAALIDSVSVK